MHMLWVLYVFVFTSVSLTGYTNRYLRSLLLLAILPPVVGTSHDPNDCLNEVIQLSKSKHSTYIIVATYYACILMYFVISSSFYDALHAYSTCTLSYFIELMLLALYI